MDTSAAAAPVVSPPRPWLVSARVDLGAVFAIGVLWSAMAWLALVLDSGFLVVAALFAVLIDFPHVLQTSLRVGLDPTERARHGRHYVISLAVIAAAVGGLTSAGQFIVVVSVFAVWQVWHVVKQHIGMVSIYAARAAYRGSRRLAKHALVLGCLAPVLYRFSEGIEFGEYNFGERALPFSGMSLPVPPIPGLVVVLAYVAAAVAVGRLVVEQVRRHRGGQGTLPPVALLTIGVAIAFYSGSYLLLSDPYALTLIATTFHSMQYHLISWARNRGRYVSAPEPAEDTGTVLAWLSRPRALLVLAVVLIAAGSLLAAGELLWLGAVPFTITLHHFYLDGILWKPVRNPGLADHLGMRGGSGPPA